MKEYVAIIISLLTPLGLFLCRNIFLNWIKSSFVKDVEQFKHELDLKKEIIKDEINRDTLKANFHSTSKQTLYPELYEKLRVCEGRVAGLYGLRFSTDYDKLEIVDLEEIIQKSKLYKSAKETLLSLLLKDKKEAVKQIKDHFANIELFDAKKECTETKNFLILKALYFSSEVRDLIFEIIQMLNSIIIDVELRKELKKPHVDLERQQEQVTSKLESLEQKMRYEIFGGDK